MSIKRIISWLLVVGSLAMGNRAWGFELFGGAQPAQCYDNRYALGNAPHSEAAPPSNTIPANIQPFGPVGFEMKDQPFAPADISDYGNGPKPKIGFFFGYDRLEWSISRPFAVPIGNPNFTISQPENGETINYVNSESTNFITSKFAGGNRFEAGYMDTNHYGWMTSVIDHVTQTQHATFGAGSVVLFDDPNNFLGLLPAGTPLITAVPQFTQINVRNRTVLNGVELMRMYRALQLHYGGELEVMYGVRFFQIDDDFSFGGSGGGLDQSLFESRVQNNIVGPQFAARWYKQRGRWVTSAEGRFMAAVDMQNFHQYSILATNGGPTSVVTLDPVAATLNLRPMSSQTTLIDYNFTPLGELRLQAAYEITRSVAIKVGYTAMYMGGITRASNRVDYTLPNLGVLNSHDNQGLFVQGLTFGFEVNR